MVKFLVIFVFFFTKHFCVSWIFSIHHFSNQKNNAICYYIRIYMIDHWDTLSTTPPPASRWTRTSLWGIPVTRFPSALGRVLSRATKSISAPLLFFREPGSCVCLPCLLVLSTGDTEGCPACGQPVCPHPVQRGKFQRPPIPLCRETADTLWLRQEDFRPLEGGIFMYLVCCSILSTWNSAWYTAHIQ